MTFRSFRDPASSVEITQEAVFRYVRDEAAEFIRSLLARPEIQREIAEGRLVSADAVPAEEPGLVLQHEKITPVTFPHEWPPSILLQSGKLTLHLARRALDMGLGLKDATPYNVQFRGSQPVFVDWTSFEQRPPGDPVWRPLAQFVRTFLLPLLVWRHAGLPPRLFFSENRENLTPERAARLVPLYRRSLGLGFRHITLPLLLSSRVKSSHYQQNRATSPEKAQFILRHLLDGLEKDLDAVARSGADSSHWSHYMGDDGAVSYTSSAFDAKKGFVENILRDLQPSSVLDIGCNTGFFSVMAAQAGAPTVVALDDDAEAVERLARRAIDSKLPVLPLHVSISNPTPALGWGNVEFPSFLDRMKSGFDLVMMLAVVHHLEITERTPLTHVLSLAAHLCRKHLLIEFVPLEDPMARQILRGREHLHQSWTRENFERTAANLFTQRSVLPIPGSARVLYLLDKR